MTDPTTITIDPGEPERVIRSEDTQMPHIVEVSEAPVRFAHKKSEASRGATLRAGQSHTLSNFRGMGLWLAAVDQPASVRVRPAGASVDTQPPKDVTVLEGDVRIDDDLDVSDRASREIGKARVMDSDGVLIDPPTEQKQDEIISLLEQIEENTA